MTAEYTPENLNALMSQHRLASVAVAAALDVSDRTVRRWCTPATSCDHRPMRAEYWRRLQVHVTHRVQRKPVLLADADPMALLRILVSMPEADRGPYWQIEVDAAKLKLWNFLFVHRPDVLTRLLIRQQKSRRRTPGWWDQFRLVQRRHLEWSAERQGQPIDLAELEDEYRDVTPWQPTPN